MQRKQKNKKYYVMHRSALKLNQSPSAAGSKPNIFTQLFQKESQDYFPTSTSMENPFTLTETQEKKNYKSIRAEELSQDYSSRLSKSPVRLHTETIYKVSKVPTVRFRTEADSQESKHKMPPIQLGTELGSKKDRNSKLILSQRSGSTPLNSYKLSKRLQRLDERVQSYLYQHSIVGEVAFNADLRTRCGDQYFQQLLRDRHKDEMKPMPYVYSLKDNVKPVYSSFVKYVREMHPEIKIREKMKLKGINRKRIKTEQDNSDEGNESTTGLSKIRLHIPRMQG